MTLEEVQAKVDPHGALYPKGFWAWLKNNKPVAKAFIKKAREAKARGFEHWSARAILHVLRWETCITDSDENYKVNNNSTAGLARLSMDMCDDLSGFFRTREYHG